ncbi:unnamed protein product [Rhizoctonia solani]|uniref:Uncharacterized protein n=1 Tax=Rhizoctonia solani TaxID=456999 RepID=A0A8H3DH28_9AGAM|nr:unnamed protein product [Rhizoctonia solani]
MSMILYFGNRELVYLLASMNGKQDADEILSKGLDALLAQHIDNPHPDQIIRWDPQASHGAIVSKEDALILLDLLFKDRKGFLLAWSETRSPTLNGLLFVLRRRAHTSTSIHLVYFIDIARRNHLAIIINPKTADSLERFQDDISKHQDIWYSRNTRTAVDLEDTRTQLYLITKRIRFETATESCLESYILSAMGRILNTLPKMKEGFTSGVEDLFIPLLEEAFCSAWGCLEIDPTSVLISSRIFSNYIGVLTSMTSQMIQHLIDCPTAVVRSRELLQVAVDLGIIEMMAKSVLLMDIVDNPIIRGPSNNHIAEDLRLLNVFGDRCLLVLNFEEAFEMFEPTFTDWIKVLHHKDMHDGIYETRIQHEEWFKSVTHFWHHLGDKLGYTLREVQYKPLESECSYTRCHDPQAARSGLGNTFG